MEGGAIIKTFNFNKNSMMNVSTVFAAMFQSEMIESQNNEVNIIGYSPETVVTFGEIITNMVLRECDITPEVDI